MNQSKHIVIVCPALAKGGAVANVALNHGRELSRWFRITMISQDFPEKGMADVQQVRLKSPDFSYLRRFSHVPREVGFALTAKATIKRMHKRAPVDVVIAHGHAVAAIALVPLLKQSGIPYTLVTHGDIFDRPKGTYDSRLTWLYEKTTPYAYRNAELIVALSPHMAWRAKCNGGQSERIVVIPNGIAPEEIGLTNEGAIRDKDTGSGFEVLYVGRLSIEKGVDILLEAVNILVQRGKLVRLRIIGTGKEEKRCRSFVEEKGLNSNVEFLGQVARAKLGQYYSSTDVVCVPSRSDPLPTVVLEALTCGIPVIGTNAGGIPFMIKDGATGMVLPTDEPEELANSIQRFIEDSSLARKMGKAAYTDVRQSFTWTKVGERLRNVLMECAI